MDLSSSEPEKTPKYNLRSKNRKPKPVKNKEAKTPFSKISFLQKRPKNDEFESEYEPKSKKKQRTKAKSPVAKKTAGDE